MHAFTSELYRRCNIIISDLQIFLESALFQTFLAKLSYLWEFCLLFADLIIHLYSKAIMSRVTLIDPWNSIRAIIPVLEENIRKQEN